MKKLQVPREGEVVLLTPLNLTGDGVSFVVAGRIEVDSKLREDPESRIAQMWRLNLLFLWPDSASCR